MKKDIEWFRGRLRMQKLFKPQTEEEIGYNKAIDEFSEYVDQLDEPEVLSQAWIVDNRLMKLGQEGVVYYVPAENLQNILVPTLSEMEKVQVSQKTADELNRYKELGYSLKDFLLIASSKQVQEKFARAWLYGFTVEEEQKYYILNKTRNTAILVRMFDEPTLDPTPITEIDEVDQFTEQEIKDYDERFWPFAVKVEELEE